MSAYVVSKQDIDGLVQAAIAGPSDGARWLHAGDHFAWRYSGKWRRLDGYAAGDTDMISPSQLGQALLDECVRSVSARYPSDDVQAGELPGPCDAYYLAPYVFSPIVESGQFLCQPGMPAVIAPPATIAEIAKAISHYEYQSCEHDDWRTSEAHAICASLKESLLHVLPGFAAAPWGHSA